MDSPKLGCAFGKISVTLNCLKKTVIERTIDSIGYSADDSTIHAALWDPHLHFSSSSGLEFPDSFGL